MRLAAKLINEKHDLWTYLQSTTKPIVIYGMGDGAIKIVDVCKSYNIQIAGIFASDEYVRGHSFLGYQVKKLSEIEAEFSDFIILLAFAVFTDEWVDNIYKLAEKHELYAPDVPVVGGGLFTYEYYNANRIRFRQAYQALSDERSREVYCDILNFKLSGKLPYLSSATSSRSDDIASLLSLSDDESYVDLGAYDGDTVLEFISHTQGKYKHITAFEPDFKNYRKLLKTVEHNNIEHIECLNLGSYSHQTTLSFDNRAGRNSALNKNGKIAIPVNSVDNIMAGFEVSYIKMDVEGAEFQTIKGCENLIKTQKPKLNISAYHRNEDLFMLPLFIKHLNPNYKIYLRHNQYIPAWETLIYAI